MSVRTLKAFVRAGIHSSRLSDFAYEHIQRPLYPIDGYFDRLAQEQQAEATSRL